MQSKAAESKKEEAQRKQREDQLDRDLADTFPASDTPAQISSGIISRLIKKNRQNKQNSPERP